MNKILTLLLCTVLLSSCFNPQYDSHQRQIFVFGTLVNITIWHHDAVRAEQAIGDIDDLFKNMHQQWHAWKPGRLQDINTALRAGKSIELTPDEAVFMRRVIELSRRTNHHFNPAIGELINLWGFHTDDYPITSPPPTIEAIQQLANQQITVNNLHLNDLVLSADNQHIWLDFGGIAKGLAVDQAIAIIRDYGIENAIVNAGGDLRSIGQKGDRAWRIGIQSPKNQGVLAELQIIGDEAVFTSGNYQRYKAFDDKRYAHIIDGRTGLPVQDIISATVIATDGITADAAATALIVAGSDHWLQVAKNLRLDEVLLVNSQHKCLATDAMFQRLKNLSTDCEIIRINE
ncbi:FAD:protein FMN transferase [Marinicella gelatinilytica]|uniref:FAD:protein FMN transferase n=1 Tax=Marinicella gelatinilytica TaxID=2996017 RepID=UPI002260951D|nr:FAD:protein FMN transferase [Marinicella gelatinilytica]MCX7544527.1 FAD:protein FMN transferase [Marinicella gelatinilytica]